jgi:hypothetical protein
MTHEQNELNGPRPQDIELPAVHEAANVTSGRGQKRYVFLSLLRLVSLLVAAIAGALGFATSGFDLWGFILLAAFLGAAVAEFALIRFQPERDWYAGRAIAESTKTLAWRFAVQGEPFGPTLEQVQAEAFLRDRIGEVSRQGRDRIIIGSGEAVLTSSMSTLRNQPLEVRRASYIHFRTENQRCWYSLNAHKNELRATAWRYGLLVGELLAVVLAAVALGRNEPVDFAGIMAAAVASGAAWLAIKQHSQLTSAYRVAAAELALQADVLRSVDLGGWPQAVADAEEAISREHTMWLASRGQEPLNRQ